MGRFPSIVIAEYMRPQARYHEQSWFSSFSRKFWVGLYFTSWKSLATWLDSIRLDSGGHRSAIVVAIDTAIAICVAGEQNMGPCPSTEIRSSMTAPV